MNHTYDVLIIGGGAAGFFAAINLANKNPNLTIALLERGKEVLSKVRISGGGRCNVTHAEFIPKELSKNYPRGERELLGPFHQFMSGDTIAWFEERGVELKIEEDGRMFPVSDSSETIIRCFLDECEQLGIPLLKSRSVQRILKKEDVWQVETNKENFTAKTIILATGSNPKIWKLLENLGHTIVPAVPSLFTFNIKDKRIESLAGISTYASVEIINTKLQSEGPLLITHWGMSGPGILKLSAWGARILNECNYQFQLKVNWLGTATFEDTLAKLKSLKQDLAKQQPTTHTQFELPKRLWVQLVKASMGKSQKWADLNKTQLQDLAEQLTQGIFQVNGKSTFKEEFVTAGGVDLKEVNFKTFESKLHPNLFFAGEILNIDAITGGFNFQNAWTGAYIAAKAIAEKS